MRRVLILGGTAWLGREIASAAARDGAAVTCLARGESGSVVGGADLVRVDRRRVDAYRAVEQVEWDAVVELSYDEALVVPALAALAPRARHWTLVSSVSVYASNGEPGADEAAAVVEPQDLSDYAQAKVAAERASVKVLGDRLLVARLGLIAGPGDGSDRFSYWVSRLASAKEGPVLIPEPAGRWVQVIDVADVASWIVHASGRALTGVFNVTGHSHAFDDFLTAVADLVDFSGTFRPASDTWLEEHDVRHWAGPRSLPLWLPRQDTAFARRDITAFLAAGGQPRDLRDTIAGTLQDELRRGLNRERRSGLSRGQELDLLNRLP